MEVTNYVPGRTVTDLPPGWYDGGRGRYVLLTPTGRRTYRFAGFARRKPTTGYFIDTYLP